MATFDQLSAEQRAIIELVLRQGKTYAELAEMLGMPEDRVRALARESLDQLAPVTTAGVDAEWRGQLADYILGQQAGPEVTATRGHLRRSEPARSWTRSLLDSLDSLYPNGLPEIPQGERGARRREPASDEPLSPAALAVVRRRRLIAAGAGLIALLLIVLVWPIGLLTGGDDDGDGGGSQSASGDGQPAAQSDKAAGVAVVALQGGKYRLVLQATNLPALKQRQAYEVWLYNSRGDAKSIGAQVLDQNGGLQGQSEPLSRDELERYRFVDVSLEPVDNERSHSGQSVLRGRLSALRDAQPKAGQAAVVSNAVLKPPG